jgi:voltage-gated potassium channel
VKLSLVDHRDARLALKRQTRLTPLGSLLLRAALVFGLIGIAIAIHWFDRDGLRDNSDGHINFGDVLYFTMITVTTVGYGDIVPVTPRARMFDTFVVTPVRLFVWLIFLGTAYDFVFKRAWDRWRMKLIQNRLHGHVVVAGYGTSGGEAVAELLRRGTKPEDIVVIDSRQQALESAEALGVNYLCGDASRNAVLEAATIARARAVVISAGRDDTSILIVLTARQLSPDATITVVIRSAENEDLARQAGANSVINPVSFAGLLVAGATQGSHLPEYMRDLATAEGRVALNERPASPDEIGQPLSAIATGVGVRIYRGDQCIGFWEEGAKVLQAGDTIIEIVAGPR